MFEYSRDEKKEVKEVNKQLQATGDLARRCLELDAFKVYESSYMKVEEKGIETLHRLTETYKQGRITLEEYGSRMFGLMVELKCLKSLMVNVKTDAKKGLSHE